MISKKISIELSTHNFYYQSYKTYSPNYKISLTLWKDKLKEIQEKASFWSWTLFIIKAPYELTIKPFGHYFSKTQIYEGTYTEGIKNDLIQVFRTKGQKITKYQFASITLYSSKTYFNAVDDDYIMRQAYPHIFVE